MACGVPGGYTKVVYGTTVGMTTSTEITGLLAGTRIGDGETLTTEDAAGDILSTGVRIPGEIHTSLVTGSVIAALITAAKNCNATWFRFYAIGGTSIKVGGTDGVKITVSPRGAAAGELHRHVIAFTKFAEDSSDLLTFGG